MGEVILERKRERSLGHERRERDRNIWEKTKLGRTSNYIQKTQHNRSRRYRASIENKSSIDREVSRRYRRQKVSIDRGRYRGAIEQTNTPRNLARWIVLSIKKYRAKTQKSRKKILYRGVFKQVLRLLSRYLLKAQKKRI